MKYPQTSTHASIDLAVKKKPVRSGKKGNVENQSAVDLKAKAGDNGRDEIIRQLLVPFMRHAVTWVAMTLMTGCGPKRSSAR